MVTLWWKHSDRERAQHRDTPSLEPHKAPAPQHIATWLKAVSGLAQFSQYAHTKTILALIFLKSQENLFSYSPGPKLLFPTQICKVTGQEL